jgi:pilus assembly protein CpaE
MPQEKDSVRLHIKNLAVQEEIEAVIASLEGFELQRSGVWERCNLLILEIGEDLQKELDLIREILTSGEVEALFLTSPRFEADIVVQALRAGVKEFFSQPIKREELVCALLKFRDRTSNGTRVEAKRRKGRIIHVMGGKGGVGATTIAVNLSTHLGNSNRSQSVVLLDMNLLFGEVRTFLDLHSDFTWEDVVKNISRLDVTYLTNILTKHPSGIFVLPSPTGLDGVNRATPEIIEKLLRVMQETFDFVVVDAGPSIDDISLKIIEMADPVLVVTILSLPCLTNVKRLLWTFQKLGFPPRDRVKVLVNRYHRKSLISLEEAEKNIGQKILWQVPNDYPATMSAINEGKALSSLIPGAEISKSFKKLSSLFFEEAATEGAKSGFWGKFLK